METRRQFSTNTSKPYSRKPYQKKEGERTFGERKYQPRDTRFQPRNDRFQDKDNRFQKRDGRYNSRNDRFPQKRRFPSKGKPKLKPWEKDNRPRIVSDLQITDGKHRGKYMQTTPIPTVKMTARRIRETLFKILYKRIRARRFLDLCAGTGAVGLEAISRGAMIGTFVERSARLCGLIKKNMEACNIKTGHGEVVESEVVPFLKKMAQRRRFWDVVFFNPAPDANNDDIIKYLSRGAAIKPQGILVIEHHSDTFFPEKIGVLRRWRVVVLGETTLSFYDRQ